MLERDKEILQDKWAADNYCDVDREYIDIAFRNGVDWADEHPSKENIFKFIKLFTEWMRSDYKVEASSYIKQQWNRSSSL